MRSDLLTAITSNTDFTSNCTVSSELPWDSGGSPLYINNKKHFYLSAENKDVTELFNTLDQNDVMTTETTLNGYLTVDAKNQPSDIDNIIANVLLARNVITSTTTSESSVTIGIEDDYITYEFLYRFVTV
jgi:hypothetical protein